MGQFVYTMFVTNNYTSFHFWWKENLVKHENVEMIVETSKLTIFWVLNILIWSQMELRQSERFSCIFADIIFE